MISPAKPRRFHKDCPNCNGWWFDEKQQEWKPSMSRYTVGMICPICGHDYMKEVPSGTAVSASEEGPGPPE